MIAGFLSVGTLSHAHRRSRRVTGNTLHQRRVVIAGQFGSTVEHGADRVEADRIVQAIAFGFGRDLTGVVDRAPPSGDLRPAANRCPFTRHSASSKLRSPRLVATMRPPIAIMYPALLISKKTVPWRGTVPMSSRVPRQQPLRDWLGPATVIRAMPGRGAPIRPRPAFARSPRPRRRHERRQTSALQRPFSPPATRLAPYGN